MRLQSPTDSSAARALPPVAILAGGLGTRLGSLTEQTPKALVEVAGRPFIVQQLELLRRRGLRRIVVCLGHHGEQVRNVLGDGTAWGVELRCVFDGAAPLGTAGALKQALPELGATFFVLYGDAYLDCDYAAVYQAFLDSGKAALMTVFKNDGDGQPSNVEWAEGRIRRYDKTAPSPAMRHIDYGLGVFQAAALAGVPEGRPADLAEVYQSLLARQDLAALEVPQRFHEIGSPEGLAETRAYVARALHTRSYLAEAAEIARRLDTEAIESVVRRLAELRARGGRLFILGVGGSAGNASHAVNDFRKIAGIEAYAPSDNVSELTARINDDGWERSYADWLKVSRLSSRDLVLVLSVGGGDAERNISANLVRAVAYARAVSATICGILGRDGGYTARHADACVLIPSVNPATVTAHAEAFQAVVWHLMVSHPALQAAPMKWESLR